MDRGFFLTLQTVRRQLAAMPWDLYQLRLIHRLTRRPFPAEPLWQGCQLAHPAMLRFLRLRNREGYDVYLRPYADRQNAGYILLDLDTAAPNTLARMRADGHQPCVVTQTSAGHFQAWVRVSPAPLLTAVATRIGQHLARTYGGDRASTDWCHLGRLAGFTNQKPARRQPNGYAPWIKLVYARAQLASRALALIEAAQRPPVPSWSPSCSAPPPTACRLSPTAAAAIYHRFLTRLRIPQRFPQPDWSIADLWIAQALLRCRIPVAQIEAILQLGSPGFPRRHGDPQHYLARTLRRAALDLERDRTRFPARPGALPVSDRDREFH